MFDFLTQKISSLFSRIKYLDDKTVSESLTSIQDTLLEADVPYSVVEQFIDQIRAEIVGQKLNKGLKPSEQLAKIVHDKIVDFLGGKEVGLELKKRSMIMVMGLQGSGKTTTVIKLAHKLKKEKKIEKPLVASVDYYRPAAIEQLHILADQNNIDFLRAKSSQPMKAAQEIYDTYKKGNWDLLVLDTAGRLHVDSQMIQEIKDIDFQLSPEIKIFVLDAMTGQESLRVAQAFNDTIGFHGAILTKMDSDTRAGSAFAFRYVLKKSIYFVGNGEKADDLNAFYPVRIAQQIIGMGDMQTLVEKANEKIGVAEQEDMYKKLLSGNLNLEDFAQQMNMMNRLGSLSSLLKYIPGMGSLNISAEQAEQGQEEMGKFKAIISSMTPKERKNPGILNGSRRARVARGAGVSVEKVNTLLKRFEDTKHYAKLLKTGPFKQFFR